MNSDIQTSIPLLILRLEGVLQSWGLHSRWDVRDSGTEPSKSGIIGLLGCALGYTRKDPRLEQLDFKLSMGIREERPGILLEDFQTIAGAILQADRKSRKVENTIITPKMYLQDAAFLVVLAGDESLLQQLKEALDNPRWPLYLGRKNCIPTRPIAIEISTIYADIEDALRKIPWDPGNILNKKEIPPQLRCVIEDPTSETIRPDRLRINPVRMYESRSVRIEFFPNPNHVSEVSE